MNKFLVSVLLTATTSFAFEPWACWAPALEASFQPSKVCWGLESYISNPGDLKTYRLRVDNAVYTMLLTNGFERVAENDLPTRLRKKIAQIEESEGIKGVFGGKLLVQDPQNSKIYALYTLATESILGGYYFRYFESGDPSLGEFEALTEDVESLSHL